MCSLRLDSEKSLRITVTVVTALTALTLVRLE
jgi:hypothetical protein